MGIKSKKQDQRWMVTYSDLVTLLMMFFVLLFTVAKIEGADVRLILSAFNGTLGLFEGGSTLSKGRLEEFGLNVESLPATKKGHSLSKSVDRAFQIFKSEIEKDQVDIDEIERGIIISLISEESFLPGSARLTEVTKKSLTKVGLLLREVPFFVRVEGHADFHNSVNSAVEERYDSNWELASQRSINIVRFLQEFEDINPRQMSAVSLGEFRPLVDPNDSKSSFLNRRVDIFLLKDKEFFRKYKDNDLTDTKMPGIEYVLEDRE